MGEDGGSIFMSDELKIENNVKAFFDWKKNVKKSVEKLNINNKHISGWEKTDVLYSFIMIYQIGIYAFYPEECIRTNYKIKNKNGGFFSLKCLLAKDTEGKYQYERFKDLNKAIEDTGFIEKYTSPGNVMPIWPGGNIDKGTKSYCFDIPDLYFYKYKRWAYALQAIYYDAYLDSVINSDYAKPTNEFLNCMDKDNYKKFLEHICSVIDSRNEKLSEESYKTGE